MPTSPTPKHLHAMLNRTRFQGILAAGLVALALTGPAVHLTARAQVPLRGTPDFALFVVEPETGRVLNSSNHDQPVHPASLTKLMTVYLVFYQLSRGYWSLDHKLKVSDTARKQPPSKLGLSSVSEITVEDAILALIIRSANDVATVIAENMSGNEANFGAAMTATARRLGMSNSRFINASGLYHPQQYTTARDMALLAYHLWKDFPSFYGFFSRRNFKFNNRTIFTHNSYLDAHKGSGGMKTGYIDASGHNLVATLTRDGTTLIGVLTGARTAGERNKKMIRALDHALQRVKTINRIRAGTVEDPTSDNLSRELAQNTFNDRFGNPYLSEPPPSNKAQRINPERNGWMIQLEGFDRWSGAEISARQAVRKIGAIVPYTDIRVVEFSRRGQPSVFHAFLHAVTREFAFNGCRRLKEVLINCRPVPPNAFAQNPHSEVSSELLSNF